MSEEWILLENISQEPNDQHVRIQKHRDEVLGEDEDDVWKDR